MIFNAPISAGELRLECDAAFASRAHSTLRVLAERDARRPALAAGSRVQFGWSVLTMQAEPGGLRVMAPDYSRDALHKLDPNLDETFRVVGAQVAVLRATGATGVDARFESMVLVDRRAKAAAGLFLRRLESVDKNDSGWVIGDLNDPPAPNDTSTLEATRVYQLLRTHPAALQLLALPVGWFAALRADRIVKILDESDRDRWPERAAS